MTRAQRSALLVSALLAAGLALTGCSASSGSSTAPLPAIGSSGSAGGGSSQSDARAPESTVSGANDSSSKAADRSVVVTGSMTVTTAHPLAAADRATAIVEAAGGRIDGRTETAATKTDEGSASLILRIPAAKLTATLDALKKLGRADRVDTQSADVTQQVQDTGARIDALRASIQRLLELEGKAADTTNLIAIETAISDRQGELESLEAQQRGLDDQVSMSTITLDLRSDAAAPPVKPADFWSGLGTGWSAFAAFWAGTLVVFGVLLPWIAMLLVAAAIVVGALRLARRRARTQTTTPSAPIG